MNECTTLCQPTRLITLLKCWSTSPFHQSHHALKLVKHESWKRNQTSAMMAAEAQYSMLVSVLRSEIKQPNTPAPTGNSSAKNYTGAGATSAKQICTSRHKAATRHV